MTHVGRQIGRYRILEQVGQGGMSVVYKGLDTRLERQVAVKVLHPHLATRVESRKRLEREAQAVARLRHPNILEVFDYAGADADEAYLVTEFIHGQTLRAFISEETLQPPEIAAMVVHELASALAHAHELGVLHRDLKPENVMVREDGVLKLTDFGIAKILDKDEKMTMTGALVGSPAHMAPEIIEGEEAGPEADVFSLGTMLYLFATGKLPFSAANTTATLKRILDCAYDDPRQVTPTVSDDLAEIIASCLQRRPADRFASAAKLRDALAAALSEVGLTRPHEELPKFFLEPRSYRRDLVPRLTRALLSSAEEAVLAKRAPKALSALNQVLAHDPGNQRALALVGQMRARKVRAKRLKKLARNSSLVVSVVLVGALGWTGIERARRAPDPQLKPFSFPSQVALASVSWPSPAAPPPSLASDAGTPEAATALPRTEISRAEPRVGSPKSAGPNPPRVQVEVRVRPWGVLTVDSQRSRSNDELPMHRVELAPGIHTFKTTCELCVEKGDTKNIEIGTGPGQIVRLVAPLRPALVSFAGYPKDAVARIGGEERRVAETENHPFRIACPPEGCTQARYDIAFEVSLEGRVIDSGRQSLKPGGVEVIEKRR